MAGSFGFLYFKEAAIMENIQKGKIPLSEFEKTLNYFGIKKLGKKFILLTSGDLIRIDNGQFMSVEKKGEANAS